ncbi:MAG: glycosyltransferase family 9 protein [Gemmatimonadota bacterium]|nr:glycosyltransferase family 9 protein [Gemmatimonadota bacterium]MDE2954489.1 glycosyltransferase family 9 protein [Gemmatimonadota bacterium]
MTTRKKILIFRPDHIGDLLLTTPALYALRKAKPHAHISVLTSSWSSPILMGNPDIDDILICDLPWLDRGENPSYLPLLPIIHQIRSQQYDHILNFRIAAKAAAFSRLLGAKERWGFDVLKSRWAWTHAVPYNPNQHVVDNYMALARAYTRSEDTPVNFRIFPETADLSGIDEFMHNSPPAIVLGVTSGRPDKSWLPDRWAKVADHIAKDGFRILLNGGPTEETDVQMVQSLMHHPAENLVGRFSLLQFAGLLKRCAAIITLDSFPMHLAAALGIPTIALFGANSSTLWGPYPGNYPRIIVEPPPEIPRNAQAMKWIQTSHVIDAYNRLNLQQQ